MKSVVRLLRAKVKRIREKGDARRLDAQLQTRSGISWQRCEPCPSPLYDSGAVQIGNRLYVVCGYISLDTVSNSIEVFDLENKHWMPSIPAVPGLAQTHCAVATDRIRYIYFASGQIGPQCNPAVRNVFSYNVESGKWLELPPLPFPRYAGTMQFWRGRLHFVGGAAEDRWTPKNDHWSIGVESGLATEAAWETEKQIPFPGMHRGSIISNDKFFVFGGQQGDFIAIEGDPDCRCNGHTQETYIAECFRLDNPSGNWVKIADMPIAASHNDFSVVEHKGKILSIGGQIYKSPTDFSLCLTDAIQVYDPEFDRWSIAGYLPYRLKMPSCAVWDDAIFASGGQRGKKDTDKPGPVTTDIWCGKLQSPSIGRPKRIESEYFDRKKILMLTHDLSYTGAPLLMLETAQMLMREGATVLLSSAADDINGFNAASEFRVPVVPFVTAAQTVENSDIVVVNTVTKAVADWVAECLNRFPDFASKLIWWVHEIDVEKYLPHVENLKRAALVVFDSEACRSAWTEEIGPIDNSAVIHPAMSDAFVEKTFADRMPFSVKPNCHEAIYEKLMSREEIRKSLGVKSEDFLICCVGTVMPRKGQKKLLLSLSQLAMEKDLPIKLMLVGFRDYQHRSKFLSRMSSKERNIMPSNLAYVWQKEIVGFYRAADAFVMNTQGMEKARGECFGRVTVEAMANGCVVLGTAAGGTQEIIQDGETGFLFPTGSEGQAVLVDRIVQLVRDSNKRTILSNAGAQRALGYFRQSRFLKEFEVACIGAIKQ